MQWCAIHPVKMVLVLPTTLATVLLDLKEKDVQSQVGNIVPNAS